MKVNFTKAPEFLLIGERSINSGTIESQNGAKVFLSGTFKQVLKESEVKALLAMSSDGVVEPEDTEEVEVKLEDLTKKELTVIAEELVGEGNVDKKLNKSQIMDLIDANTEDSNEE